MNFEVYQIIVPLIGLFSIGLTLKSHRGGNNTLFETFFWVLFWLGVCILAIIPDQITFFLSDLLGIKDNVNAIIFIGLALSFFIHFKTFVTIKRQNKQITDLVRKTALEIEKLQKTNQ
ncbi:DUF2304 domain-containing protein [uncultured Planktosalinus sp.]|uniref:DUF2304 domain-containing protein n=1 Tax=uncultured Planktosalinus sp. TaxID=1810935 RepID=UPI0030D723E5|tara:strand:- start:334 stop:687 length:354 start_codon:yes stop_codon:yes gene_type:complete